MFHMKLGDYLKLNKMTQLEFAKKTGISPSQINKYILRNAKPKDDHMINIRLQTNDMVGPNDFYPTEHRLVNKC